MAVGHCLVTFQTCLPCGDIQVSETDAWTQVRLHNVFRVASASASLNLEPNVEFILTSLSAVNCWFTYCWETIIGSRWNRSGILFFYLTRGDKRSGAQTSLPKADAFSDISAFRWRNHTLMNWVLKGRDKLSFYLRFCAIDYIFCFSYEKFFSEDILPNSDF